MGDHRTSTWPGCARPSSRRSTAAPRRPTCRCPRARATTGTTRRTDEGKQYGIHCRVPVAGPDDGRRPQPSWTARPRRGGAARRQRAGRGARVLRAGRRSRSAPTATCWPTPPTSPATSASPCGSRTCRTGELLPDEMPEHVLRRRLGRRRLHAVLPDRRRRLAPPPVWRHTLGTTGADDVLVYEEADERFWIGVELTRSEPFIIVDVPASSPGGPGHPGRRPARRARVVAPAAAGRRVLRRAPGRPLPAVLHNDDAENFALALRPGRRRLTATGRPLIAARPRDTGWSRSTRSPTWSSASAATGSPAAGRCPTQRPRRPRGLPPSRSTPSGVRPTPTTHRRRSGSRYTSVTTRTPSTTTTSAPASWCCASRTPVLGRLRPDPTTSSTGTGPAPTTAPGCRSRWSAGRHPARRLGAVRALRLRLLRGEHGPVVLHRPAVPAGPWRRLRRRARPRRRRAGPALVRRGQAAAEDATPSPTSSPAPGTWSRPAGPAPTGWSPGAARPAAC